MRKSSYFENIRETFSLNHRLTRLYTAYLESCPDIITADIVKQVIEGTELTQEDALVALLCSMFGLDTEKNQSDRRLEREYLYSSVKIMSAADYTENPYYKNIKLPEVKLGEWEIKQESYKPYRGVIAHDMIIKNDLSEIPPLGFFTEEFSFPAVLEGGNEWMTLTPVDIDTSWEAIGSARGKVITFGLGLGYYAYMVSEKRNVEKITVVEKSPDVIKLFKTYILPQFNHPEKVEIIEADAFDYAENVMPTHHYDVAFVDTWRDAGDGAPMYCKMKPLEMLSPETEFHYWIEGFIISRLRAIKFEKLDTLYTLGRLDMSNEEIYKELTNIDKLIK